MRRYDPNIPPEPSKWLALPEEERIALVERYHKGTFPDKKQAKMHCVFHTIVENQIALGDETPARDTLIRLMNEGMTRHEAVHAIGAVVAAKVWEARNADQIYSEEEYFDELRNLTAEKWREEFGSPE